MSDGYDLAVIGAGIVGLAHAYAAARLGKRARRQLCASLAAGQCAKRADGEIAGIRFNHRSLQPLDLEAEAAARWYAAYQRSGCCRATHAIGAARTSRVLKINRKR